MLLDVPAVDTFAALSAGTAAMIAIGSCSVLVSLIKQPEPAWV